MTRLDRSLVRGLVAQGVVLLALTGMLVSCWLRLNDANRGIRAGIARQTPNAVTNVLTLCVAVNQGREYDRAFIARVTHHRLRYTLADLPCTRLAAQTLQARKPVR